MTNNNIKIALFGALIVAMIIPFNGMSSAYSEQTNRDRTEELRAKMIENQAEIENVRAIVEERNNLIEQINSGKASIPENAQNRIDELNHELDRLQAIAHQDNIPEAQLQKMMKEQAQFEKELFKSDLKDFVTSIGIHLDTKEIQIGLNQDKVNSSNIAAKISQISEIMPEGAQWHVVLSDTAVKFSCTDQQLCVPAIGGNEIRMEDGKLCSFGYKATKSGVTGFVTAGHCFDGKVGQDVDDEANDFLAIINQETHSWGTDCDCGWAAGNTNEFDNKVYISNNNTPDIDSTVSTSNQQNDFITKSGRTTGVTTGQVSAINQTVLVWDYYVTGLVRSNTPMSPGDSGGTVVDTSTHTDLYGVAAAGDAWGNYHMPVEKMNSKLGTTAVLG
ncbi:MAG: hypothetical protein K8Q89_11025 [Nitrosarchaeum sp.]|nr:hypothetical protein [Nitrosarchaeum sp.]